MGRKYFILFIILAMESFLVMAQQDTIYKKELFIEQQDTLAYRMLWPVNFDAKKQYPLVLFLHGAGERGNDNEKQLVHGSSLFASHENRKKFPAIVVFPQCPTNSFWSNTIVDRSKRGMERLVFQNGGEPTKPMALVLKLMDSLSAKTYIKKDQVYVAGLSMGGMGTFEILSRNPDMFAAAISICGGGNEEAASKYAKKVPIWVFHGAKDEVVHPNFSIKMVSAILKTGGYPKFTLYDDANHNSWDPAFAEPDFLSWLFSKKRNTQ
ncbi:MAG: prolyl oligopeptidase family serine peptidase [Saonia sp.]